MSSTTTAPVRRHPLLADLPAAIRLSIPMASAQLASIALQVTDNIMCGRLGASALAGAGLGGAFYAMMFLPLLGMIAALSPLVAHAYGSRDPGKARASLHQALLLALGLGLLIVLVLGQAAPILTWLGQPAELVEIADRYLQAMRWAAPPALIMAALRCFLDSQSMPRIGLIVAITGIFVNLLGNWLLIFGHFGLPALGVAGSGWATVSVNVWMALMLAGYLLLEPTMRKRELFAGFRPDPGVLRELLRVGVPAACAILAEVWLFTGMSFLMGYLGTSAVAAHQIALGAASTTFMIALGISNASTVRVGQALGRGDRAAARQAGLTGTVLGLACMSLTALLFWQLPQLVIGVYIDIEVPANAAVVTLATALLHLAALFQLFDALQVTSQGALRGFKDTFAPMLIGVLCYWGVGLGSAVWLCFGLGMGAPGLWTGLVLGLMSAGAGLFLRFNQKSRL